MSVSPVSDESVFKKWNSVSKVGALENFPYPDMKAPTTNVSVRLDLFPDHKTTPPNNMEFTQHDNYQFSKWHEKEQLNNQVVFINPEWDEIEEEKSGIPTFFTTTITPTPSSGDKSTPSHLTEFVVTDSESVSSVTVSLDEFTEESEEIVAVISDSEAEVFHADLFPQVEGQPPPAPDTLPPVEQVVTTSDPWKDPADPANSPTTTTTKPPETPPNKRLGDPTDAAKLIKASCYVMQNGKITKPFYIVKNPILREDAIYKNINKTDDLPPGKRPFKVNQEEANFVHLGRTAGRKKEVHGTPKFPPRNQEFIRIIEHPARAKKIIVNKMADGKVNGGPNTSHYHHHNHLHQYQGAGSKKPNGEVFRGNSESEGNSCEGEDLMWLLDFKLDDFFSESSLPALSQLDDSLERYAEFPGKFVDVDGSVTNFSECELDDKIRVEIGCQTETLTTRPNKLPNGKTASIGKQQLKVDGKGDSALPNRTFSDLKCSENRKPPFTYTELIECALQEKGPLTVSEIYNWISETFPYYKSWDDRWKNSVRHNLSINPYFRKGTKARQGSGHLWTVNKSDDNSKINNWKRHRFHEFEEFSKRLKYAGEADKQEPAECISPDRMIDETELATASIEDKENRRLHRDVLMAACIDNNFISTTNVSLEQSAEEILSGVKKNVEVQYLEPVKSPCEDDFLNPISKEILMGECGLLNQIELNLTAETGEHLSIVDGMTDSEHIFGISDELNFHYDMPSHTPQLLPLAK